MTSTLFILQIVLAILITILVLLQKSSSIGLGAYSGSNESLFGAKGPAGFLTKATFIIGLLFVINTLALGYFYSKENKKSAVDTIDKIVPKPATKPLAPQAPLAPTTTTNGASNKADNTNAANSLKANAKDETANKEAQQAANSAQSSSTTDNNTNSKESNAKGEAANNSSQTQQASTNNKTNETNSATKESETNSQNAQNVNKAAATNSEATSATTKDSSTSDATKENSTNEATTNSAEAAQKDSNKAEQTNASKQTKESSKTNTNKDGSNSNVAQDTNTKQTNGTTTQVSDAKKEEVETKIKDILHTKSIKFATDSSFLEGDSITTIKEIAQILKEYPNVVIEIGGHTDNSGNEDANKKLSQERVDSVRKALIEFGVNEANLKAVGYGSSKPLVDNNSAENRAKNRRVEFRVLQK